MNNLGQVVGTTGSNNAFIYTNGTVVNLGSLPLPNVQCWPSGINDNGTVVGTCDPGNGYMHGFIYGSGGMVDLGTLPNGLSYTALGESVGLAINNSGRVVGYSAFDAYASHAFEYVAGVMSDLGTLPTSDGTDTQSYATAVNNGGQVVGASGGVFGVASDQLHAFLSINGSMSDLGTLTGGSFTYATGINDGGELVGYGDVASGDIHPFLYSGGAMIDLGVLPGSTDCGATGINNAGQVVGYCYGGVAVGHSFFYSAGTLSDLNSYVSVPSGAVLTCAVAINSLGQIADFGSDSYGYLLTPTVPIAIPKLSVASSHSGAFLQGQINATYAITVSNASGAGPSSGTVTVTEALPTGVTLVSMAGTGWTCPAAGTTCTRSDVLNSGSSYLAITVTVNVASNAGSPLTNTVSVSGGGSPTANASDATTVIATPQLSIASSHSGAFLQGQNGASYTITVSNAAGAGPTSGTVTATEALPTGLTLVSMAGTGWTCPAAGTTCTRSDVLNSGSGYPAITATVNVASNAGSPLTNTVSVSGGGSPTANASDATTVTATPRLSIASTHSGSFVQGQNGASYTITVSNASGAGPTSGTVTVTETLPTGLTLVSMAGTGWTCRAAGTTCTRSDVLNSGSGYPAITATVNVASNAGSPLTNTVSVSGGGSPTANASDATFTLGSAAPTNLTINSSITASTPCQASTAITITGGVTVSGVATCTAGSQIILLPSFTANAASGASFTAIINPNIQ
jgi:uncharacterized repeat protein (TIGR01451 family)